MSVKTGRFVYGGLQSTSKAPSGYETLGDPGPEFAVEIVREYGANELIGKLYRKGHSGDCVPVDSSTLEGPGWRQRFPKGSSTKFEMAGSGAWKVLHLRIESDQTGPYVAIALRYPEVSSSPTQR
jgi:hypothetical protein